MTAPDAQDWPILPRPEVVDPVVALLRRGTLGVAVTGETGSGKTTVATLVARAVTGTPALRSSTPDTSDSFVRLRGSELSSSVPYGLLFGLLQNSSVDPFANSAAFFSILNDAIVESTGSRSGPALILVDNAHLADELSAHALSQLALGRKVTLILVAPDLAGLPEAFLELWRDGLIKVAPVPPLSVAEVTDALSRFLGSPVVASAAEYLTERAGGNPLFLHYLVIEQVESGVLVQHEGRWMLAGRASLSSDHLVGMLRARLEQWSPAQREVLEIVALLERIPFALLEQVVDAERIAELLENGVIEVLSDARLTVRIRNSLVAEVVRASVPFVRRRQLRDRIAPHFVTGESELSPSAVESSTSAGAGEGSTADYEGVFAFSAWTLDCGARLEPEIAVRAATTANRLYDPEFAIRLASAATGSPFAMAAALQKSRAWRTLGRPANAAQTLSRFSDDERLALPAEQLVDLAVEIGLIERLVAGHDDFAVVRRQARERVERDLHGAAAERQHQRLEIAEWGLRLARGDFAGVVSELEAARSDPAYTREDSPDFAASLAAMLAETLCTLGRQEEALSLVGELEDALGAATSSRDGGGYGHPEHGAVVSDDVRDDVSAAILVVYLKTGLWDRNVSLALGNRPAPGRQLYHGSAADAAVGVSYLFGGVSTSGRDYLISALGQARLRDVNNSRGEILSALAYSSALDGDAALARSYLAELGDGIFSLWHTTASATYLSMNALALLDDRGDATARMLAVAEGYRHDGLLIDELLLVSSAARQGSAEALARLQGERMPEPGPLATAIYTWAEGMADEDDHKLVDAAEALQRLGNQLFAREAATEVLRRDTASTGPTGARGPSSATRSTSTTVVSRAAAVVARANEVLDIEETSATETSPFDALTKRERDVASAAASGAANREIALALHLSVRTVESYLQSAFNKLGISGRKELAPFADLVR